MALSRSSVSNIAITHAHAYSGLFIIRRTNRSQASSILEMPSLRSDHTLSSKTFDYKSFSFVGSY